MGPNGYEDNRTAAARKLPNYPPEVNGIFFSILELGQSTVKCMRGILECWIKQAHRVELFKQRQSNQHALHCKFHLHTGEVLISFRFDFGKFSSTFSVHY